jgi:hypothetical protein
VRAVHGDLGGVLTAGAVGVGGTVKKEKAIKSPPDVTWETKTGETVRVVDMASTHLWYSIWLYERHDKFLRDRRKAYIAMKAEVVRRKALAPDLPGVKHIRAEDL